MCARACGGSDHWHRQQAAQRSRTGTRTHPHTDTRTHTHTQTHTNTHTHKHTYTPLPCTHSRSSQEIMTIVNDTPLPDPRALSKQVCVCVFVRHTYLLYIHACAPACVWYIQTVAPVYACFCVTPKRIPRPRIPYLNPCLILDVSKLYVNRAQTMEGWVNRKVFVGIDNALPGFSGLSLARSLAASLARSRSRSRSLARSLSRFPNPSLFSLPPSHPLSLPRLSLPSPSVCKSVCLCVFVEVYLCVCMWYIYMCVCVCVCVLHIYACVHAYCTCLHVCVPVC